MRRMIRSYRTRKNVRQSNALRTQFMNQLEREAVALMKRLNDEFAQSLQTQLVQLTQSFVGAGAGERGGIASPIDLNAREPGTLGSFTNLLSTGVRYLISRPRTRRDTAESSRSIDAASSFRLSQSQAASEMQALLGKAEKNA